jgi:hypothetical protein
VAHQAAVGSGARSRWSADGELRATAMRGPGRLEHRSAGEELRVVAAGTVTVPGAPTEERWFRIAASRQQAVAQAELPGQQMQVELPQLEVQVPGRPVRVRVERTPQERPVPRDEGPWPARSARKQADW